jgi:hypothetical protein
VKVENVAGGREQVFKLPEAVINERFNTVSGKGAAHDVRGRVHEGRERRRFPVYQ